MRNTVRTPPPPPKKKNKKKKKTEDKTSQNAYITHDD